MLIAKPRVAVSAAVGKDVNLPELKELALGGTAVGTGLNTPKGFDVKVAEAVSTLTGKTFVTAENKFHALTSKDELANVATSEHAHD